MATIFENRTGWTLDDLARRFGPMPISRIRTVPEPGTATEDDVTEVHDRENRLCELVDGVLVEKAAGFYESYLGGRVSCLLQNFVQPRKLGIITGAGGMYRLHPGLVRIPDVSFIAADRLPGRKVPRFTFCPIVPDLAVEVLSRSNTKKEMDDKLAEYFAAGVRLVWYIDPDKKTARAYTSPSEPRLLREKDTLDGGDVLPGFALPLRQLFAEPLAEGDPA